MPSISDLFWILVDLTWAVIRYYTLGGSWSDVNAQWYKLSAWFNSLYNGVANWAAWARDQALSILQPTIDWLISWRNWLYDRANEFLWWVANRLNWMWSWLNWASGTLEWYIQSVKGYVQWLAGTFYDYGVWYIQTAYNYLAWFVSTAYGYVVWLVDTFYNYGVWYIQTAYGYVVWLVNTFYNYGVWFVQTAYGYVVWLVNTFYNYGVWLLNTAKVYIEWFVNVGYGMLRSLETTGLAALLAFMRDAMTYWYNVWSIHGTWLSNFLANPAEYILISIRDFFLDWLEELIAENW